MYTERERHRSLGIRTNTVATPKDPVPISRKGAKIEVEIPLAGARSADLGNKPLVHIDDYESNQKSVVAELFRRKNFNEQLNFKNTFYLTERSPQIDAEALTIFGYDKVYLTEAHDANIRANFLSPQHVKQLEHKENKVRTFLKRTEETVDNRTERNIEKTFIDLETQKEDVKNLFMKMKKMVGHIVKADVTHGSEKFEFDEAEIVNKGDIQQIKGAHRDKESVMQKTINIRHALAYKSDEIQDKIRKAQDERDRKEAEEAAKRLEEEKKEKKKIDKFTDLKHLSQKWKIWDTDKLKMTIRNEVVKLIMREEEQKNYKSMAENRLKQHEDERKKLREKAREIERKKRDQKEKERERLKEVPKQAVWEPGKLEKKREESQVDFAKRQALFNLTKLKKKPSVFRAHAISKNFVELAMEKAERINGGIELKGLNPSPAKSVLKDKSTQRLP